jgi:hypothetical protein
MTNRSKVIGTNAEVTVRDFLRKWLWPWCERLALSGNKDKGDIMVPGVCIEVKVGRLEEMSGWMKELDREKINAKADTAALWVKPRGIAAASGYYVVMRPADWVELMKKAGYG